jgi:hypothetical protein
VGRREHARLKQPRHGGHPGPTDIPRYVRNETLPRCGGQGRRARQAVQPR